MTHALSAQYRIDFVDLLASVNSVVGAHRFANIAIDALLSNQ